MPADDELPIHERTSGARWRWMGRWSVGTVFGACLVATIAGRADVLTALGAAACVVALALSGGFGRGRRAPRVDRSGDTDLLNAMLKPGRPKRRR